MSYWIAYKACNRMPTGRGVAGPNIEFPTREIAEEFLKRKIEDGWTWPLDMHIVERVEEPVELRP